MSRTCDTCHWMLCNGNCILDEEVNSGEECEYHVGSCSRCSCGRAEYLYEDRVYCSDCLMAIMGVEESLITSYYLNGEYLGSDNDDMDDIIFSISDDIEKVE